MNGIERFFAYATLIVVLSFSLIHLILTLYHALFRDSGETKVKNSLDDTAEKTRDF